MQTRSCHLLVSPEAMTTPVHACRTELLQMSRQQSRTCIPNLSCDYFSQSCSAKGKITSAVILPHEAKYTLHKYVCCAS